MLSKKVIVVTGAAGRLGRRIVQQFAEEGASIAAVVRSEEEARELPFPDDGEGWAFPIDLTDEAVVRAGFEQIRRHFDGIDAVVHTVGGWEARPLTETTELDWRRMIDANLTSTFLCFREAVRVMDGPGTLIAFSSRQGADAGAAEQSGYSAAKAGIVRLVESISDECRERGITAHAVAPSMILYEDGAKGVDVDDVIEVCRSIITKTGAALSGATIRAYGSG